LKKNKIKIQYINNMLNENKIFQKNIILCRLLIKMLYLICGKQKFLKRVKVMLNI
jgi:hypothetical protein